MNIVAQLFGLGAMVSLFLIYQQKSRNKLIIAKLSADIFWVAHYFCLGGTAGMIPNFIGIFRELIIINWLLGFRTFHSWYNLLPITASTFVTISLWIDNPKLTKIISIPISSAFLIYDIFIGSHIGVINETISICSIIIYFIKTKRRKENA